MDDIQAEGECCSEMLMSSGQRVAVYSFYGRKGEKERQRTTERKGHKDGKGTLYIYHLPGSKQAGCHNNCNL